MGAKRIEEIGPTISNADQVQGNELFIVSAQESNIWSTKKMSIQTLKDYVMDGVDIIFHSKGQVIFGADDHPGHLGCRGLSGGNRLYFDNSDVWNGSNVKVGFWGISSVNQSTRYVEQYDGVEYYFKPYTATTSDNRVYAYIANNQYLFQDDQYFWKQGDLIITTSSSYPSTSDYHGVAFHPKSDLVIHIVDPTQPGVVGSKTATVVNGAWNITTN